MEFAIAGCDLPVIIDDEDWCGVRMFKWHFSGGYVVHTLGKRRGSRPARNLRLHRFVLQLPDSDNVVDHINRNVLDNRKANLRITNRTINGLNTNQQHDWREFPKGIKVARSGRLEARVGQKHIGTFDTVVEAVAARDLYIQENIDATWKRDSHYAAHA